MVYGLPHKPGPGSISKGNRYKSLRVSMADPATTYQVLAGRKKGRRGEAHRVAVLLGMKLGTTTVPLEQGQR